MAPSSPGSHAGAPSSTPNAAEQHVDTAAAVSGRRGHGLRAVASVLAAVVVLGAGVGLALRFYRGEARGILVSQSRNRPVAFATLRTAAGSIRTDSAGRFDARGLRLGTTRVTVSATGFPPFTATIVVRPFVVSENRITLPDASLVVRISEVAVEPAAVKSSSVKVGRVTATVGASGTAELKGLPAGPALIRASAPGHEPAVTTFTLSPGGNEVYIRLNLTPAETYLRYLQAYKSRRAAAAYAYLHPDVRRLESLRTFTRDMQGWGAPISVTLGKTRMLASWTSPYTKNAYTEVAEMNRTLVGKSSGGLYTNTMSQHWARVDGLWLRVDIR